MGSRTWQDEEAALEYLERFLGDALAHRLLDRPTYQRLTEDLGRRRANLRLAHQGQAPPRPETRAAAGPGSLPEAAPPEPSPRVSRVPPPRPAAPREPSPWPARFRRLREVAAGDFAVHGLAYLGVLLLFAGTFGFVVFSFGSVKAGLRPLAEIAIPVAFFGSAWFLRGRGASLVPVGLELVGGLLLPVVVAASFRDGAPIPPDLERAPLVAALAVSSLVLAGAYAVRTRRQRGSVLRYLVAPLCWGAVWSIGLAFGGARAKGLADALTAAQMSLVAVAIAGALVLVRIRRDHPLARPSETAALPGIAVAYLFTIVLAASEGWPAAPVAVAGAATIVAVELLAPRLRDAATIDAAQAVVAAITLATLVAGIGSEAGSVVVVVAAIALFEWQDLKRSSVVAEPAGGLGVVAGLALSATDPWAAVAAFGIASVWAHARRLAAPPDEKLAPITLAAGCLPLGVLVGLLLAVPEDRALWIAGSVVLPVAFVARRVRDGFYAAWVPAAAAAVGLTTAVIGSQRPSVGFAAAAGLAGAAFALAPRWPVLRAWSASGAFALALALALEAQGVGPLVRTLAWSGLGLAVVAAASVERPAAGGHLVTAGHLATLVGLAGSPSGAPRLAGLAGWTVGWLVTVVVQERGSSPFVDILARRGMPRAAAISGTVPSLALVVSLPFLVVEAGARSGLLEGRRSWAGVALALTGIAYAAVARRLSSRRPLAPIVAVGAFAASAVGIAVAAPDPWPTIEAVASPIAVVWLMGGELRRPFMTWFAWIASGVLLVLLADRAGVDARAIRWVVLGWGALLMVGGLLADDLRAGRRRQGEGIRTPWLLQSVAVGALGVPIGLSFAFVDRPEVYGWASLVVAGLYAVVALLLRAGSVSAVSYALATVGLAALLPRSPLQEPLLLVPWCAALVAVAWLLGRGRRGVDAWLAWDAAPLAVAHVVAAVALARSTDVGPMPETWAAVGFLSVAVAAVRRHPAWAVGGVALVLIGAGASGPGWLALALAGTSAASTVTAARAAGPVRAALQVAGPLAAGLAWHQLGVWADWTVTEAAVATALASGGVAAAVGVAGRWAGLAADWADAWGGLAAVGLAASFAMIPEAERRPAGMAVAVGSALAAAGAGAGAKPLGAGLRGAAAVLALAAGASLLYGWDPSTALGVTVSAAAGFAATVGSLALWKARGESPWLRPLAIFGAASSAGAVAWAAAAWPRRDLLVAALLVAGLESAAAGLTLRRAALLYCSPVLLCGAWVVFASEALTGDPQWFTVPIGLSLLALVSIARWERRRAGQRLATEELLGIEYLGMAFLVGASLVETVAESVAVGAIAIVLGVGLVAWGAVSRVRRRALAGAGTVALAVVLMMGVPLARLVPHFRGTALWIAIAAVGAVLVVVATSIERSRATVESVARRIGELTEGWE